MSSVLTIGIASAAGFVVLSWVLVWLCPAVDTLDDYRPD